MRRSDRTGFTLTEVVVSLALVGVLSGALTIRPPKDHGRVGTWQGTLKLPKTKITLGKP